MLNPLSNIKVTKYFNCEPRFNGIFSRNNLPGIKDGRYVINFDDKIVKEQIGFNYLLTETHLFTLIHFEIEYIPQEVLKKIGDKSVTHYNFIKPDNEPIIHGFYCINIVEYISV